jgi:ferrous iron transport protein B
MERDYKGPIEYSIEMAVETITALLEADYSLSARAIALLLLQDDKEIRELVEKREPEALRKADEIIREAKEHFANPISYELALERQNEIRDIISRTVRTKKDKPAFGETLSRLTMNPVTGIPILAVVLYWGLYKFIGEFGAGTVVDFLEGTVFDEHINPVIITFFNKVVPWEAFRDLFVGEYGVITHGFKYAVALILPLVTFFFLVFSIIEDTGYLPRLAMLIDRVFKKIGLSGRAVIPMVLGFGCDTMATMVARTLPTKRERIIATMLLSLAVPCSAQLGVIMALLEGRPKGFLIWGGVIWLVFIFVGFLTAKVLPGERPSFYMELPPLRLPVISNVITKTYTRVKWYAKEVLPLFIMASFFIWIGRITKIFDGIIYVLKKPVELIGLPPEAAEVFLFGFFRRDYGAAGLYNISKEGHLTGAQLVVSCIALTLFLPCIAQFLMTVKERGWKVGLGISFFVLFFSFSVAFIVNLILSGSGVVI